MHVFYVYFRLDEIHSFIHFDFIDPQSEYVKFLGWISADQKEGGFDIKLILSVIYMISVLFQNFKLKKELNNYTKYKNILTIDIKYSFKLS